MSDHTSSSLEDSPAPDELPEEQVSDSQPNSPATLSGGNAVVLWNNPDAVPVSSILTNIALRTAPAPDPNKRVSKRILAQQEKSEAIWTLDELLEDTVNINPFIARIAKDEVVSITNRYRNNISDVVKAVFTQKRLEFSDHLLSRGGLGSYVANMEDQEQRDDLLESILLEIKQAAEAAVIWGSFLVEDLGADSLSKYSDPVKYLAKILNGSFQNVVISKVSDFQQLMDRWDLKVNDKFQPFIHCLFARSSSKFIKEFIPIRHDNEATSRKNPINLRRLQSYLNRQTFDRVMGPGKSGLNFDVHFAITPQIMDIKQLRIWETNNAAVFALSESELKAMSERISAARLLKEREPSQVKVYVSSVHGLLDYDDGKGDCPVDTSPYTNTEEEMTAWKTRLESGKLKELKSMARVESPTKKPKLTAKAAGSKKGPKKVTKGGKTGNDAGAEDSNGDTDSLLEEDGDEERLVAAIQRLQSKPDGSAIAPVWCRAECGTDLEEKYEDDLEAHESHWKLCRGPSVLAKAMYGYWFESRGKDKLHSSMFTKLSQVEGLEDVVNEEEGLEDNPCQCAGVGNISKLLSVAALDYFTFTDTRLSSIILGLRSPEVAFCPAHLKMLASQIGFKDVKDADPLSLIQHVGEALDNGNRSLHQARFSKLVVHHMQSSRLGVDIHLYKSLPDLRNPVPNPSPDFVDMLVKKFLPKLIFPAGIANDEGFLLFGLAKLFGGEPKSYPAVFWDNLWLEIKDAQEYRAEAKIDVNDFLTTFSVFQQVVRQDMRLWLVAMMVQNGAFNSAVSRPLPPVHVPQGVPAVKSFTLCRPTPALTDLGFIGAGKGFPVIFVAAFDATIELVTCLTAEEFEDVALSHDPLNFNEASMNSLIQKKIQAEDSTDSKKVVQKVKLHRGDVLVTSPLTMWRFPKASERILMISPDLAPSAFDQKSSTLAYDEITVAECSSAHQHHIIPQSYATLYNRHIPIFKTPVVVVDHPISHAISGRKAWDDPSVLEFLQNFFSLPDADQVSAWVGKYNEALESGISQANTERGVLRKKSISSSLPDQTSQTTNRSTTPFGLESPFKIPPVRQPLSAVPPVPIMLPRSVGKARGDIYDHSDDEPSNVGADTRGPESAFTDGAREAEHVVEEADRDEDMPDRDTDSSFNQEEIDAQLKSK